MKKKKKKKEWRKKRDGERREGETRVESGVEVHSAHSVRQFVRSCQPDRKQTQALD